MGRETTARTAALLQRSQVSGLRYARSFAEGWAQRATPALRAVVDGLMPRRCLVCGDPDVDDALGDEATAAVDVCAAHRIARGFFGGTAGEEVPTGPHCVRCLGPLPPGMSFGVPCRGCRQAPPGFSATAAAFDYAEPGVSDWVLRLKHGGRSDLALPLARIARLELARGVRDGRLAAAPGCGDLLVPVPLHPARLAERGYNQAGLLALELARLVGGHSLPLLQRSRSTLIQGELAAPSRRLNVSGAFQALRPVQLGSWASERRRVWLVDDVMTTGATASACAEVLRRVGGGDIRVLVLARA